MLMNIEWMERKVVHLESRLGRKEGMTADMPALSLD